MSAPIKGLPYVVSEHPDRYTPRLELLNPRDPNEQNTFTKQDKAIARKKGWEIVSADWAD